MSPSSLELLYRCMSGTVVQHAVGSHSAQILSPWEILGSRVLVCNNVSPFNLSQHSKQINSRNSDAQFTNDFNYTLFRSNNARVCTNDNHLHRSTCIVIHELITSSSEMSMNNKQTNSRLSHRKSQLQEHFPVLVEMKDRKHYAKTYLKL